MKNNVSRLIQVIKSMTEYPNAESQGVIEASEYESGDYFAVNNFGDDAIWDGHFKKGGTYLYSYVFRLPDIEPDAVVRTDEETIYLYLLN